MKLPYLPVALLGLTLCSCDKAKEIAAKARSAVQGELAKNSADSENTTPDPELLKLVDQSADGYVFRKDLPFPIRLDVKTTRRNQVDMKIFETSELGKSAVAVKGTQTFVTRLEREGDQIRYTMAESTFTEPMAENADKDKKPVVTQLAPPATPIIFKKKGGKWSADNSEGFRAVALSRQLSPHFDTLLEENSLAARRLWLGKHRIKIGTELPVTGETLPMLVSGKAKGAYMLKLESISAVKGHPCGVFTISGDYSRKQFPDFEGKMTDQDVTIQSGKIWLSLLYPLILREELDTIQTLKVGGDGTPTSRGQGTTKVSVIREWKIVSS